jgi:catechol 2,3-dioxygenase-like lactoylglutathione lyase family enzyme
MIVGAHVVMASKDPEADYTFFRDVLNLPSVDAGEGYVIFGLPASEFSVHQTEGTVPQHELHFLCEDIEAFRADVTARGFTCGEALDQGWGIVVELALPSGAPLHIYQPRHARPADVTE